MTQTFTPRSKLIVESGYRQIGNDEPVIYWATIRNGWNYTFIAMDDYCRATFGENGGDRWQRKDTDDNYYFEHESDLMMFMLKWQDFQQVPVSA